MIIEYTGRQTVVAQKYKDQAGAGLRAIEKILGEPTSAKVILTVDKYRMIVDVTVKQGSQSMVATCESAEMMTALRDALAKIEQQAVRQRQKETKGVRRPRPVEKDMNVDASGPTLGASDPTLDELDPTQADA